MAAESTSYRNLQTSFISNLNGTTAFDISLVTSFTPISVMLRSLLLHGLAGSHENVVGISHTGIIFVLEYLTLVFPTLLAVTILADHAFMLILLLLILALTRLLSRASIPDINLSRPVLDKKKRFLCNFRAYVNIATAVSILAVDFVIYPRRFAKTETYGTGLMDVGVGSFIIANALVCQDARKTTGSNLSFMKAVRKELRAVLVLIALGFVRFAAVKSTDYQEHVSEYGVHWNFFLTLACVRVLSIVILRTLPESLGKHPWIVGLLVGSLYQYALTNGLEDFVLNGSTGDGSRSNFIDANREGICSSLGYVALYFIGVSIGKLIFHKRFDCMKSLLKLLVWLTCISILCWSVLWYWRNTASSESIISRRLANFPFVIWQVGYNIQLLAMFLAVDILLVSSTSTDAQMFLQYPGGCWWCSSTAQDVTSQSTGTFDHGKKFDYKVSHQSESAQVSSHTIQSQQLNDKQPFSQTADTQRTCEKKLDLCNTKAPVSPCMCLISAVNYNLLAYFLIANVLTGAVNLSIETISAPPLLAFGVLNVYLLVLHAVVMVLYRCKILLKL